MCVSVYTNGWFNSNYLICLVYRLYTHIPFPPVSEPSSLLHQFSFNFLYQSNSWCCKDYIVEYTFCVCVCVCPKQKQK